MAENLYNILFVEDEHHSFSSKCEDIRATHPMISTPDLHTALSYLESRTPIVVVFDVARYGYEGLRTLCQTISDMRVPVIAILGENTVDACIEALHAGAHDVLTYPVQTTALSNTILVQIQRWEQFEQFIQTQLHALAMKIAYALPHEFRTPLNSLLGFISLLRDPASVIEPNEFPVIFESLDSSARRLYRIAEKFLLYAELERIATSSTQPTGRFVTYGAGEVIHDVAMETAMGFDRTPDISAPIIALTLPIGIKGQYLRFIIAELVSNACKFSEPGTPIYLTVEAQENNCIIGIQDKGRGMSSEHVASITAFNQFEREQYEQQGLGFGLVIVKKITMLYDGEFFLQSSSETGTYISIKLPFSSTAPEPNTINGIQYITMYPL